VPEEPDGQKDKGHKDEIEKNLKNLIRRIHICWIDESLKME
jgi:hypothetical protein